MSTSRATKRHRFPHAKPEKAGFAYSHSNDPYKNGVYSGTLHGVRQRASLLCGPAIPPSGAPAKSDNPAVTRRRLPAVFATGGAA